MSRIYTVNSRRFDGTIRRSWKCEFVASDDEKLDLVGSFDHRVEHRDLGVLEAGTISYERFYLNRWFNYFTFEYPVGTLEDLNVNFPSCPAAEVTGTVVTAQGKLSYNLGIEERADGRGLPYYWLRFGRDTSELREGTDLHAVRNNFVSVTPLKLDLTAHEFRDELAKALA